MMRPLDLHQVNNFVNENIVDFHQRRIKSLEELSLGKLLHKNPYLFRAKNFTTAAELIPSLLDAFLSSSEEKMFGDFLEGLAIFIAETTCDGHKSPAPSIDLDFTHDGVQYLVSIKSGPNWGNSSQVAKLEQDLKTAVVRIKQQHRTVNIQPVLGICYGKTRTSYLRGYMKVVGQSFWHLISGNPNLYIEIIEPIGFRAKEHNDRFFEDKSKTINRLIKLFVNEYCDDSGTIDWGRIVQYNSQNMV